MMRDWMRRGALAAALAAAAACGTDVKAGPLRVRLTGAAPARAAIFRVAGSTLALEVPAGAPFTFHTSVATGDSLTVIVIADSGSTLTGALLEFEVADTRIVPGARLLEVTGTDYAALSPTSYTLSIAP